MGFVLDPVGMQLVHVYGANHARRVWIYGLGLNERNGARRMHELPGLVRRTAARAGFLRRFVSATGALWKFSAVALFHATFFRERLVL